MPLIYNDKTPPIVANGIAIYIIMVCLKDFKAKNIKTKINIRAMGTTVFNFFVALSKFSKAPP